MIVSLEIKIELYLMFSTLKIQTNDECSLLYLICSLKISFATMSDICPIRKLKNRLHNVSDMQKFHIVGDWTSSQRAFYKSVLQEFTHRKNN